MPPNFKPDGYSSVSPYFVVKDPQGLIDLLIHVFDAEPLREFNRPAGSIMHAEVRVDDSVLMLGGSTDEYKPEPQMVQVYVRDVDAVYQRVVRNTEKLKILIL